MSVAHPERIILFGSWARGEEGLDSDLDLLVVADCEHRHRLAGRIYRSLIGVGGAVDLVAVTPVDVERYGKRPALVIESALREGKVRYPYLDSLGRNRILHPVYIAIAPGMRKAERSINGERSKTDPPRRTRHEPDRGPPGSFEGLLA